MRVYVRKTGLSAYVEVWGDHMMLYSRKDFESEKLRDKWVREIIFCFKNRIGYLESVYVEDELEQAA